jgi:hypothetical protein
MNFKYLPLILLPTLISCDQGSDNIDVIISNGSLQCQDNAIPIETTKSYLTDAGIEVKDENCGIQLGVAVATVCGGPTAQIHIFSINQKDLIKAENIGFTDSSMLEEGFEIKACDSS